MIRSASTPERALDYLHELGTDIRAAVMLDSGGALAAHSRGHRSRAEPLRQLVMELFQDADAAADGGAEGVEVTTPRGSVFAVRSSSWMLAVVTGHAVLSSLVLYDLRQVLVELARSSS